MEEYIINAIMFYTEHHKDINIWNKKIFSI
jgi:hypothetical protein